MRILAWGGVCFVAGVFVFGPTLPFFNSTAPVVRTEITPDQIGKPFRLTSHRGASIGNAQLAGKPYLMFFGFTYCPQICPTTLSELTDLMKELGRAADKFNVVFVSVDPERDTQEVLSQYMDSFDPRILALRGTEEQTRQAIAAFSAYAKKVPFGDDNYTMDHTAGVYVMDARGRFTGMLDMHESREVRLKKLRRLT